MCDIESIMNIDGFERRQKLSLSFIFKAFKSVQRGIFELTMRMLPGPRWRGERPYK